MYDELKTRVSVRSDTAPYHKGGFLGQHQDALRDKDSDKMITGMHRRDLHPVRARYARLRAVELLLARPWCMWRASL